MIMQSKERYNKALFFVGALWNWGASLFFLVLAVVNKQLLSLFLNSISESMMWLYAFLGAVFVFGLGYYWTSKDVRRNRDIIKMGICGKVVVVVIFGVYAILGEITLLGLMTAMVDLVFAGLFLEVLIRLPKYEDADHGVRQP
jgi:hypothetical protein